MTAKFQAGFNRFTFGEVSPLVATRSDLAKYPAGCRRMLNFIPLLQGPAQRRGGTRFIAEASSNGRPVLLLPFVRSESTAYIIELGSAITSGVEEGYARFYKDGKPVRNPNGSVYSITTPWRISDLFDSQGLPALRWVQSADVLFVVCPTVSPRRINRLGDLNWSMSTLGGWGSRGNATAITLWKERLVLSVGHVLHFSQSGAFENFEVKDKSVLKEATFYSRVSVDSITSTSIDSVNPVYFRGRVAWLAGEATLSRVSGTTYKITATDAEDGLSRLDATVIDAYKYGWSAAITGTNTLEVGHLNAEGHRITEMTVTADAAVSEWRSNTAGSGFTLRPVTDEVAADDPIELEIVSEQLDDVLWLSPGEDLLVGTVGGEFAVGTQSAAEPLGPENVKITPQTSFGSTNIQALRVGSVLLFVQRSGMKVREFSYDAYSENYIAGDISAAAEHITKGGLTAIAWQSEPLETIWTCRADGALLGLTYSKDQDMAAWHRHQLGGGGQVSHLAVIPARHGGRDELWLSVRREIKGRTVYYIERLEPGHEYGGAQADCFFVDSGLTVTGTGLLEISGLDHLEGQTVDILAYGGPLPARLVSGGKISLEHPADIVQVGLGYRSELETVNLDLNLPDGALQGRIKRFSKVNLYLIESLGGSAGDLERGALTGLVYRIGSTPFDEPPALFTGVKTLQWPGSYDLQGRIGVVQESPLPFTLAAIFPAASVESIRS